MAMPGDNFELLWIPGIKVDKHSTRGLGDKITNIVAPIASACGIQKIKKNIIKI